MVDDRSTGTARVEAASVSVAERAAGWGQVMFGRASEEPYRRRVTDMIALATAVVALTLLAFHHDDITATEQSIEQFFATLPDALRSFFSAVYRLASLWAVLLVAVAAVLARRGRLARDLLIGGFAAWIMARLLGTFLATDASDAIDATFSIGDDTPPFPCVRLAVVVAVIAVASPYLARPARRIGQAVILILALAALYLEISHVVGVLAGVVIGWGIAAAVHLVFGSPGGRPTSEQVAAALHELGVDGRDVRLAPEQPVGSSRFLADVDGPVEIDVIGRDESDAQLLVKLGRAIWFRDSGPALSWTRLQAVEHEAYLMLLANRGGVSTPTVVVAGQAGPGTAVLAQRRPPGPRIADLDPARVDDALLDATWSQAALLFDARVVHGALNASHIVAGADGPVISGFERAKSSAQPEAIGRDIAELLTSTSAIVGVERGVAAARRVLGPDLLALALPLLQPSALSRATRAELGGRKQTKQLLEELLPAAAAAAGTEPPPLQQLSRVRGSTLVMAIGTFLGIAALLSQVGSPQELWDTIQGANWWWVALALALALSSYVLYGVAMLGTVSAPIPLGSSCEAQLAGAFSNLAVPGVGSTAVQIRFLQKQGFELTEAVTAAAVVFNVANVLFQGVAFLIAIWLSDASFDVGNIDASSIVELALVAVLALGVVGAVVFGVPRVRHRIAPALRRGTSTVVQSIRSPRQLALLAVGNTGVAWIRGASMMACLLAFGSGSLGYWTIVVVYVGISSFASLIPVPGAGTAVGSVGISSLLIALGVPEGAAVAAALMNQIVVTYVPAVVGWFVTRRMLRRGDL